MAPPRSDKKRGREDASLAGPGSGELYVLGVPATIHTAGSVCAEELLHSWAGDVCVTIDRFDVRSLLDSWTPPPPERCWNACREAQGDVALDEERYSDLLVAEQKEQVVEEDTAVASGAFNAVGFAYAVATPDDGGDAAPLPPPPPLERYVPPFELPEHLSGQDCLPLTARDGAVLSRTAAYVRSIGPQSEIVLRVRHADNCRFDFLQPSHKLHAFFRYLVTHDPETTAKSAQKSLHMLSAAYMEDDEKDVPPADVLDIPKTEPQPLQDAAEALPPAPAAVVADAPTDPSQPSAEQLVVMDKLIAFVVKSGPEFEAVTRKRQAQNPNFAFLQPWNPLNAFYLKRLATARGDTPEVGAHAPVSEQAAAHTAAQGGNGHTAGASTGRKRRWDVAPAAETETAPVAPLPDTPNDEELARRQERLRRAREFSAQRAAAVQASVVSAHASLTSLHRAALLADGDADEEDGGDANVSLSAVQTWQVPRRVAQAAAGGLQQRSLAEAHADRLFAAMRASQMNGGN